VLRVVKKKDERNQKPDLTFAIQQKRGSRKAKDSKKVEGAGKKNGILHFFLGAVPCWGGAWKGKGRGLWLKVSKMDVHIRKNNPVGGRTEKRRLYKPLGG